MLVKDFLKMFQGIDGNDNITIDDENGNSCSICIVGSEGGPWEIFSGEEES